MVRSIGTHILFQNGRAKEAVERYGQIFADFELDRLELYEGTGDGPAGQVKLAEFRIGGHRFLCIDSPVRHGWEMTPGIAPFIECEDDEELERLFAALADGGTVHVPLGDYGFDRRFGVSWLLHLP